MTTIALCSNPADLPIAARILRSTDNPTMDAVMIDDTTTSCLICDLTIESKNLENHVKTRHAPSNHNSIMLRNIRKSLKAAHIQYTDTKYGTIRVKYDNYYTRMKKCIDKRKINIIYKHPNHFDIMNDDTPEYDCIRNYYKFINGVHSPKTTLAVTCTDLYHSDEIVRINCTDLPSTMDFIF